MRLSSHQDKPGWEAVSRQRAAARRRPVIEELEPRILYSADFAPAILDAHAVAPAAEHRIVDAAGDFVTESAAATATAPQAVRHEVVFVDTAVPDYQKLVQDITANSNTEHQYDVVLLNSSSDGIKQITQTLAGMRDVSAVHIISHGADGEVELGNATLNFDSLLSNAAQIKGWSKAFAPGADLLIYGCDVAEFGDGKALVNALSRLTGGNVAASEDLTGAADKAGNWTLEYQDGFIDTQLAVSAREQASWKGILDAAPAGPASSAPTKSAQTDTTGAALAPAADPSQQPTSVVAPTTESASAAQVSIASTPLAFEQNVGQAASQVDYVARGNGYVVGLVGGDAVLALQDGSSSQAVRLDVVGKNADATAAAENLLQSKTNYLVGGQDQWRSDVANFGAVRYDNVYDGIDLRYYGNQKQLEYDFLVNPGASVSDIQLKFDGVQSASVADNGDLVLTLDNAGHTISFKAPVAYQDGPNGREAVASHYRINEDGTVGFDVGSYDANRQLVIDPVLSYGTYFGGNGADVANGIAVDAAGNVYLAGYSPSGGLLNGLLGGLLGGGAEVFVAKFSPNLGSLLYSTYVGGNGDDFGTAIAVDANGNAYVTGSTASSDLPTASAFDAARSGSQDAFVFKLNAAGNALVYSSYLGGTGNTDIGWGIALDASGNAYVTGVASSGFPVTAGAADTTYAGGDAFVAKVNATGNNLVYCTFVGGSAAETGFGIAVDMFGNAVVVGETTSSDFPTTPTALRATYVGGTDAFVTKLNSTGTGFLYGTYLGGSGADLAYNLALDNAGKIYVTGETSSNNFAVTAGALKTTISGATDAFMSIVDPNASGSASLVYSTYLGGSKNIEAGLGIGVDAGGRVYVSGGTDSTNFPVTPGAYQTVSGLKEDAFLVLINPVGAGADDLVYGTYFGGNKDDYGDAGVYSNGQFYLAGDTLSSSRIATAGAYDTSLGGSGSTDAFAAVFTIPPAVSTTSGSLAYTENVGPLVLDAGIAVSDPGIANLAGATLRVTGNYVSGEDVLAFNNANSWGIAGTWDPATATLVLTGTSSVANYQAALRSVTYQNTSDNPSTATRTTTITVSDGVLNSPPSTRQIAVTPVNDPPLNIVPGAQTTSEDSPLVFSSSGGNPISISDVDVGPGALQVSLNATNGALTLAGTSGLTFVTGNGAGNSAMTFTGSLSSINAALNGLRFDPATNFNGLASLQLVTNDQGNTGTGGPLTATSTVAINVTPVNDAPVNSVPGPQSTQEDTPLVFSSANGNSIRVGDVDASTGDLQVTLTPTNGTLTLGSSSGLTSVVLLGPGTVVITGTLPNLNAALDGLKFTPTTAFTGSAALVIATNDQGNTGSGGAQAVSTTLGITVSGNVAPTVTTSGSALGYVEKAPATPVDASLTVADPDSPILDHAIVSIAANYVQGEDVLSFANQPGISGSWNAATGTLTLTGADTVAHYQAALRSVTYQNLSADPSTAPRTINFVVNDSVADGGVASRNITVTAVNDPPLNTVPVAQSTNEDTTLVFSIANGNEIRVADPDAGSNPIQVQLSASNGTLTLAQVSGLTISAGANGSSTMTVKGTVDDINAALNGLSFDPVANYDGPASIQVVTDDLGNSGTGGSVPAIATIAIGVAPVNDAPQGTDNTISTLEDTPYVFTTADFGFIDSDDSPANNLLAVRMSTLPTAGSLTDNGVTVTTGQLVSVSDIAGGKLQFTPTADANGNNYAGFTFQVQDDGGSANGGTDMDPVAHAMTINVTPVNDPPQGTNSSVTTPEDTPYTFLTTDFGFDDSNDNPANNLLAIKITTLPTAGLLTVSGVGVSVGQYVSASDISAGNLQFLSAPDANGPGYASFGFQVQDDGGNATGGVDIDPVVRTLSIDVAAVNDGPVNLVPGSQSTMVDTPIVLSGANAISVSDVDANGGLEQITLNVASGTLNLGTTIGLASFAGNGSNNVVFTGTLADLNSALNGLTYTPGLNYSGSDALSITTDDLGNTGSPGHLVTTSAVGITVQPNQAPTLSAAANNPTFTEAAGLFAQAAPVNVFSAAADSTIESGQSIIGLTFTLDGLRDGANESIGVDGSILTLGAASSGFTATNGVSYNVTLGGTTTATVTLSSAGGLSTADLASLIDGITYQNTNTDNPSAGGRVFRLIQIQDSGGSANGGADTRALNIASTVNVAPVNDAPVNLVPGSQSTLLNTPIVLSGANAISVGDVDANGGIERITLTVSQGTLTLGGTTGLTFSAGTGTGDTTVVFSGTLSDLNNALNGLSYTPANNYSGVDMLSVTSDDLGNTGAGGPQTATDTVAINVNYSAPGVTTSGGGASYTEKSAPVPVDAGLTLSAGSYNDLTGATVQISGGYALGEDLLTLVSQPVISQSWDPASGTLTLSGTASVATYQAALQQVRYQDTSNDPSTAPRTVIFTVSDGVTTQSAAQQVSVTAVNDAPALTAVPLTSTFQEAAGLNTLAPAVNVFGSAAAGTVEAGQTIIGLTFNVAGLRDGANESIVVDGTTITLGANSTGTTATNGMGYSVTLSGTTAATVNLTSAGGASAVNIATLIDGITYQNTSTNNPSAGTRLFTLTQIQDSGGTANGGQDAATLTVAASVNVVAVNDAPANSIPGAQTTNANTSLIFSVANGNGVQVLDVDANAGIEQVTLSVAHGSLGLSGTTGLTLVSGVNGSASMTYRGTLANLNTAVNGLTYTPSANYSGTDTLSITSSDQGSTGSGGALISATTVGITVNAPPPVVVPPPAPPPPAPTPTPGPSSPPTPGAPPTPAPPSSPPAPPSGGGSTPTGGSGVVPEPAQPVAVALVDQTPAQALVVGDGRARGADLIRAQSVGPTLAAFGLGAGLPQEAMLPAIQTETLTISSMDPEFARASETLKLAAYRSTLGNKDWVGELNRMRETVAAEPAVEHRIVGSTVAVTGAMSIGYVIWLLRGGLLLSSLLSSLPAWHTMDPMPVLARSNNSDEEGADDDPLENLFGRAKAAIGLGRSRPGTESAQSQSTPAFEKARQPDEEAAIPA